MSKAAARTRIMDAALVSSIIDGQVVPCRNESCQIEGVHPAHNDVPKLGRPIESVMPHDLFLVVDDAINAAFAPKKDHRP